MRGMRSCLSKVARWLRQGAGRVRSGVYMVVNEHRNAARNAVSAASTLLQDSF
jgi:hypothetical protein